MENVLVWIRSVLSSTPARWESMAKTIPAELFGLSPAPKEWSARECLQHLIDTENVFQSRIQAFLAGKDFPAFNPDKQGSKTELPSLELAATFTRLRQEGLAAFDKLQPADLERKARHAELGPVTLREMVNEWATHDLVHTMQAERSMMQPFLSACGPWQVYFKEHAFTAKK